MFVVATRAYVIPGGMSPGGIGLGHLYNDPLTNLAGGVANSLNGLGSPLGRLRVPLVRSPIPIGGRNIGGFPGQGGIGPQGLRMDYGFLNG